MDEKKPARTRTRKPDLAAVEDVATVAPPEEEIEDVAELNSLEEDKPIEAWPFVPPFSNKGISVIDATGRTVCMVTNNHPVPARIEQAGFISDALNKS